MITSGITITLNHAQVASAGALEALRSCTWLELGPTDACHIAAVLEAPTPKAARERFESLQRVPGVELVRLVVALFDEGAADGMADEPVDDREVEREGRGHRSTHEEQP